MAARASKSPARVKHEAVTEDELVSIIDKEIAAGITFKNDTDDDRREVALDYYDGKMDDLPAPEGRSAVVSRDVAEVVDTMLPGIMRIFSGAGRLGVYQPARPGDEETASQATVYANHVFERDCNGYLVMHTWVMDALQVRNGVVKIYWDTTPEYDIEQETGLTADQVALIFMDGSVTEDDILGFSPRVETIETPQGPQQLEVFDIRFRRVSSEGRVRVENIPPEDFGISASAKSVDDAPCVWHTTRMTRSELVKRGHPQDLVDTLPSWDRAPTERSADRNTRRDEGSSSNRGDRAMQQIEIVEAYLYADRDGDGIAENRKVLLAGNAGGRKLLEDVEWPDDRPFVDMTPQPVPHRWMGKSVADNVMDLQRVKTALWRAGLDNTYANNFPDREVKESAIVSADEVKQRKFGNIIRVKESGAIRDLAVPFVAANTFQAIQAVDALIQRRTGVSQATAALDETAIDPQTATATQIKHDAAYSRVELVVRNMAEIGLKRLFAKLLRIMVRNQDRPRTIRLRDDWVNFDPRVWNASMDVNINLGMGTGSRERDLAMLQQVLAMQLQVIERLGPDNPIVTPSMVVATQQKIVEATGLKDAETYFKDVSDAEFQEWMRNRPPPPPDPREAALQARIQADQARLQNDMQRAQIQAQIGQSKVQGELQLDRETAAAELQLQRDKIQQEYMLKVESLNREFALRQQEVQREAELRAAAMVTGAQGISVNLPRQ